MCNKYQYRVQSNYVSCFNFRTREYPKKLKHVKYIPLLLQFQFNSILKIAVQEDPWMLWITVHTNKYEYFILCDDKTKSINFYCRHSLILCVLILLIHRLVQIIFQLNRSDQTPVVLSTGSQNGQQNKGVCLGMSRCGMLDVTM